MTLCYFASDLHGSTDRYRKLFRAIHDRPPDALFLGGDLLPTGAFATTRLSREEFIRDFMVTAFEKLRQNLGRRFPRIFLILGNDDPRSLEETCRDCARTGIWTYVHGTQSAFDPYRVYGYSCIPPSPFLLKDWERYDVSRYVDPGCVSPEDGVRSVPVPENVKRYSTIHRDLEELSAGDDLDQAIFLFHTPPYQTTLDRAALDGRMIDHVPLDVHVGSIAVRRFIESRQPLMTLHGHIHESSSLTGSWKDCIGRTQLVSAAFDGPELAMITFDPDDAGHAERHLF